MKVGVGTHLREELAKNRDNCTWHWHLVPFGTALYHEHEVRLLSTTCPSSLLNPEPFPLHAPTFTL